MATSSEFARSIKAKYPQYQSMDDSLLTQKVLQKYPQYQSKITEPKKDGLIKSAVKGFIRPAVNVARDVGGGLYSGGAAIAEIAQRLTVDPQNKSKTFDKEFDRGMSIATPKGREALLGQDIIPSKQIGLGAQRGAGVASYLVPGGKTLGTAAKLGAVSGGLYGASEGDKIGAGNIVGGLAGGAAGGFLGGVLAKGAGALKGSGPSLSNTAAGIRKSVISPKVQPSPFAATEEREIAEGLVKILGKKDTAEAYRKAMPGAFEDITKQISGKLGKAEKPIAEVADLINTKLDDSLDFVAGNKVQEAEKLKLMNALMKSANKSNNALKLTDKTVHTFKQHLGGKLTKVFDKMEKGTPLNDKEAVTLAFWGAMDEVLTNMNPSIKELTRKQALLYKAAPGLQAAAKAGNKPMQVLGTNIPVPASIGQTAESKLADVLGKAAKPLGASGNILNKVVDNNASRYVSPRVGAMGGSSLLGTPQELGDKAYNAQNYEKSNNTHDPIINPMSSTPQQEEILSPGGQWKWDAASNDWIPNAPQQESGNTGDMRGRIYQLALKDLQETGGKNFAKLQQLAEFYDYANPAAEAGKAKTEGQVARQEISTLTSDAIGQLKQTPNIKIGILAGPTENLKAKFDRADPATYTFNITLDQIRGAIAKARAGSAMSPQELALLDAYTPKVGDSRQEVVTKLMNLQKNFGDNEAQF